MDQPVGSKIRRYQEYMVGFEGFCLGSRPSMFPAPGDIRDIREVHQWLTSLHEKDNIMAIHPKTKKTTGHTKKGTGHKTGHVTGHNTKKKKK